MKLEEKVRVLEATVAQMQRELARMTARPPMPRQMMNGWWLGALTTDLHPQSTATVRLIVWDPNLNVGLGGWAWMKSDVGSITIHDFWMNDSDDAILHDTRIKVIRYRNVWTYDQAYCVEADNLPDEPEEE